MTSSKFASHCALCPNSINHEIRLSNLFQFRKTCFELLCRNCREAFRPSLKKDESCYLCQREILTSSLNPYKKAYHHAKLANDAVCFDCYRWLHSYPPEFLMHQFILPYNALVREWLYRYKYQGDYRLSAVTSPLLQASYRKLRSYSWLCLPSSPLALKQRGFHPVSELLKQATIPHYIPFNYLGDGVRQASKSRQSRMNLQKVFAVDPAFRSILLAEQQLLLFDDVYTTGATAIAAKLAILDFYHSEGQVSPEIISLSLSRDHLDEDNLKLGDEIQLS